MRNNSIGARTIVWVCASWALAATVYAGRHNPSMLLIGMFVLWVLAPFAAMDWLIRRIGSTAAIFASIAALLGYAYASFGPPQTHGAFLYLLIPALSWIALGVLFWFGRLRG